MHVRSMYYGYITPSCSSDSNVGTMPLWSKLWRHVAGDPVVECSDDRHDFRGDDSSSSYGELDGSGGPWAMIESVACFPNAVSRENG
jgi:hypothetical protein